MSCHLKAKAGAYNTIPMYKIICKENAPDATSRVPRPNRRSKYSYTESVFSLDDKKQNSVIVSIHYVRIITLPVENW